MGISDIGFRMEVIQNRVGKKLEITGIILMRKARLETGWITIPRRYLLSDESGAPGEKGAMLTGWQNIAGNTYYFEESGSVEEKMYTGWQNISYRKILF